MPRHAEWTRRLDGILADLESWPSATIDRAAMETLLGVSPRQALRILHQLAGHRAGQALLIGRGELREKLTQLAAGDDVRLEQARHRKVTAEIMRLATRRRAAQMAIAAAPPGSSSNRDTVGSLPPEIRLTRGKLEITFSSGEELLTRLMELAQAIAADPASFDEQTM